jgi:ABC-type transport system substrate-binding protein
MVQKAIVADDAAGTVTFTLDHPTPYFLQLLANSQGVILDKEYMAKNGAWDGEDCTTWRALVTDDKTKTNLYDKENGTGPYKLDRRFPGRRCGHHLRAPGLR